MNSSAIIRAFQPFGLDPFCLNKKFLVFNLLSRNLKTKYHRSVFGLMWTLIVPISMAAIYYFVFKLVMRVQLPHYLAFVVSGVFFWTYISQTLVEGMESLMGGSGLLTKVPMPVQIFPFVGALTNLITLCVSLPILVGVALISGVNLGPSLLMVPVFILSAFLITYFLSFIFAVFFVHFRDMRHILGIVMQLWLYGTPVFYHESMIPSRLQFAVYLNPYGTLFVSLHRVFVDGEWPTLFHSGVMLAWVLGTFLVFLIFQKYFCSELVEKL
jgi:ABC-type polysaccharide/polyol phosphate export permease